MAQSQPPDKDPFLPPTLDPAALDAAAASLAPALELLERFHHRNKNQHRLSKWWAQADMLRRHVRKMLGELEDGIEEAERAVKLRARKVKGKKKEADNRGGGEESGNTAVAKRAEYLRWKLGPGAYLAFTQLTADRQFAHLGLMLLGVLAQVDKAITPFAPAPQEGEQARKNAQEDISDGRGSSSTAAASRLASEGTVNPEASTDMGEAVSREDAVLLSIERDEGTPIPRPAAPAPASGKASTERSKSLPSRVATLQKDRDLSTSQPPVARTEPASKEGSSTPALPRLKKKKKVGPEGGDEFDDIFGSLEKEKKPKKKKRKKGDEFDDIFGGLL